MRSLYRLRYQRSYVQLPILKSNEESTSTMNTEATTEQKLSLRWIYLAWVGVIFSSVVIGIISVIAQGPPEPIAAQLGINNFSIFAIALYSLGTVISVVVLLLLIRSKRMGMSSIGFSGSLTFQGVFYALIGLVAAFILYPSIEAILQPIGIKMLWRGAASSVLRLT